MEGIVFKGLTKAAQNHVECARIRATLAMLMATTLTLFASSSVANRHVNLASFLPAAVEGVRQAQPELGPSVPLLNPNGSTPGFRLAPK